MNAKQLRKLVDSKSKPANIVDKHSSDDVPLHKRLKANASLEKLKDALWRPRIRKNARRPGITEPNIIENKLGLKRNKRGAFTNMTPLKGLLLCKFKKALKTARAQSGLSTENGSN